MKTNEKIAVYGGAALIAFVFLTKARALANLVLSPGTVDNMGFQGSLPVATVSVLAQNTSGTGLTINSFAGNVFSNNILVGNVYNFSPVFIAPNSMTPIAVQIQFKALGIVNDIIRAFQQNNFSQDITVNGFANVSGLQLPVNVSFTFGNQNNPAI